MHDLKSTPMLASDYLYSGYVQTRCNLPCSRDDLSAAIVRYIISAAGSYISAFWANRMIDLKKVCNYPRNTKPRFPTTYCKIRDTQFFASKTAVF